MHRLDVILAGSLTDFAQWSRSNFSHGFDSHILCNYAFPSSDSYQG